VWSDTSGVEGVREGTGFYSLFTAITVLLNSESIILTISILYTMLLASNPEDTDFLKHFISFYKKTEGKRSKLEHDPSLSFSRCPLYISIIFAADYLITWLYKRILRILQFHRSVWQQNSFRFNEA